MLVLLLGSIVTYSARVLLRGHARDVRTDSFGGSALMGKSFMEIGYWLLNPPLRRLAVMRVRPNTVTAFSIAPAVASGIAVAYGWFGLACVMGTAAGFCDILDGMLARMTGVSSEAGEAMDAVVDRYGEAFFLAGVAVYYREYPMVLLLAIGALVGGFMVSYSTARAEAAGVPPPRGVMRRAERAVYLLMAAGLEGFSNVIFAGKPLWLRGIPMIPVLALVAVLSNVSAVARFCALAKALRARVRISH
jgi:phosphatidylglycerophosphate synthase